MSAPVELRAQNPVEMLDGALLAVRRGGLTAVFVSWAAGAGIALVAIATYFLERVEGVRTVRPALALAFLLAYALRSVVLSRVARDYVRLLRPSLPVAEPRPSAREVLDTAVLAAFGFYAWMWPLVGLALLSPWAIAAAWPFLAIRGAVAPSWLARASCGREHGTPAFGQAFDDTAGMRAVCVIVELLALLGTTGVFANLYAVLTSIVLFGHSLLGLDLAFVSSFLSPDNGFLLLLVASGALVLMEPLRAAISARIFIEARARRDGADLHVAVDELVERQDARRAQGSRASRPSPTAALLLLAVLGAAQLASVAQAQPTGQHATDRWARERVDEILARPEFRELPEQRVDGLGALLQDFFNWLRKVGEESDPEPATAVPLPAPPGWLIIALILAALALVLAYVLREERSARRMRGATATAPAPIAEAREPKTLLDDAAVLASRGEYAAALRALYVATLVALDRNHVLEWVAGKTNGDYVRAMPRGEMRNAFGGFTRIFDRVVYGHTDANADDYARCRAFAERIVERSDVAASSEPVA